MNHFLRMAWVLLRRRFRAVPDEVRLRKDKWNAARGGDLADQGLCVALDLGELKSLSQVGRDFIDMLSRTDISFDVFDMTVPRDMPMMSHDEIAAYDAYVKDKVGRKRVVVFNAAAVEKDSRYFNILTPFWEFKSGMIEAVPDLFKNVNHVIAFSDFCADYFRTIAPPDVGVSKIRYPMPSTWVSATSRCAIRARYRIAKDAFVVFFHFDFRSGYDRKNPIGALRAFLHAFDDDRNAVMVIKASGGDWDLRNGLKFRSAVRELGIADRLVIVDDYISHQDILDLIAASDVYLSLHRGEGFGIGMLESMCVGTPVVCTGYGGNMDFTTDETAFLVGYEMVKPVTQYHLYRCVREWPEPNENQASEILRSLRSDPELGRAKALAAKRFISEYFSLANFERDVKALISDTEGKLHPENC